MIRPTFRLTLLATALAASSAWAAYQSSFIPAPERPAPVTLTTTRVAPADVESTLDANETVVIVPAPAPAPVLRPAPIVHERVYVPAAERAREPAIEVTRPRLTRDQRIQADVIDLLARNPAISGKIGVVSEGSVVTLTGYTATSGQAYRAAREARSVDGVREVQNLIRARVGGSA